MPKKNAGGKKENLIFIFSLAGLFLAAVFLFFCILNKLADQSDGEPNSVGVFSAVAPNNVIPPVSPAISPSAPSSTSTPVSAPVSMPTLTSTSDVVITSIVNPPAAVSAPSPGGSNSTDMTASIGEPSAIPEQAVVSVLTPPATTVIKPLVEASEPPNILDPSLIFRSFSDNFSSPARLDFAATDLYQDKISTAVFFAPDYDWQTAAAETTLTFKGYIDSFKAGNFNGPYNDRRCLDDNCLEQKDKDLYYNNRLLALPAGIRKNDIAAVSLGSLSDNWLVGFTLKDGAEYRGQVFYFDGQKFTPLVLSSPITSSYFGLFGFGGEKNDFLVIYGAYQGIAYRVRGTEIINVSRFFNIRTMNNGFKAEVMKVAYQDNVNWYIFSSSSHHPFWMKLWQNRTPEIIGAAVFDNFFTGSEDYSAFRPIEIKNDKIVFLAKIKDNNVESYKIFTDRGFKNTAPGTLTFRPISFGGSPFSIEKISEAGLDLDSGSVAAVKFLFSADDGNWREIVTKDNSVFFAPALKSFRLKVTFAASTDKFYSPFLEAVLFDYYCRK
ncbi:MAG: hypothetical protein WC458_02625 [Patescibacteria group bacterium]